MQKIDNWALVATNQSIYQYSYLVYRKWNCKKLFQKQPKLFGEIYGSVNFADGSLAHSPSIKKIKKSTAKTIAGVIYELGTMNAEYEMFEKAVENKIPVIHHPIIINDNGKLKLFGNLFDPKDYSSQYIAKHIIWQDISTHIITLDKIGPVFVDWFSTPESFINNLIEQLPSSISMFCNKQCEPYLHSMVPENFSSMKRSS